jgi:hypothetical protein
MYGDKGHGIVPKSGHEQCAGPAAFAWTGAEAYLRCGRGYSFQNPAITVTFAGLELEDCERPVEHYPPPSHRFAQSPLTGPPRGHTVGAAARACSGLSTTVRIVTRHCGGVSHQGQQPTHIAPRLLTGRCLSIGRGSGRRTDAYAPPSTRRRAL